MVHIPVLLAETLEALAIAADGIYVDATFGAGGHARAVLERLSPQGRLIAFDADPEARARVWNDPRLTLVPENFRTLAEALDTLAIPLVDGVYYDLGVSSMQFDDAERGFSFRADAPLDMRLDPTRGASAAELIAETDETELADIIYKYGEERASRRIARALVARKPTTTLELASIVSGVVHVRGKRERTHPATRTFQALRIAVNDELGALEASLGAAMTRTREGGRIAVISFHSLEDRIVKTRFRDDARVRPVVRKPIVAGADELASNPRSRSAKLRAAERVA